MPDPTNRFATYGNLLAIASAANETYAKKGEAAPSSSSSDGSQAGPILSLSAKGWAEQDSTTGKNLLPNLSTTIINGFGITVTANADGSMRVHGTSNGIVVTNDVTVHLVAGTYTLSKGAALLYADTGIQVDDGSIVCDGQSKQLVIDSERDVLFRIRVSSGKTIDEIWYPQLELGSVATEYEPYSGGAPSPSPSFPQEIRVCRGHEVTGKTGRFVDLVVKQGNTTLSTTPIPLPSRGWAGALPDGTADTLTLDGAGKVTWERKTNETTQAVTDGVTGTVGVDVLSTTGQIANGATVLYKLATPVIEERGYVEMPEIPVGAELRIPELDDLGVRYCVDDAASELARMWYERTDEELGDAIVELAGTVANDTKVDNVTIKRNSSGELYAEQQSAGVEYAGVALPPAVVITSETFSAVKSTLSEVSVPTCVAVGDKAFYDFDNLSSIDLPACTTIGVSAFYDCGHLSSISLPMCTTVGIYAFCWCNSLTTISLPACTLVSASAFLFCKKMEGFNLPWCVSVGGHAFCSCYSLARVNLPVCKVVGTDAFASCSSLSVVTLPECTSVYGSAFMACSKITDIKLPACTTVGAQAFFRCSALTSVSLPVCKTVSSSAFKGCYSLVSLYMTSVSSVPNLGTSVFDSTPIGGYSASAGQFGSVYVPASLVNTFKTATNWSSISARIVGV